MSLLKLYSLHMYKYLEHEHDDTLENEHPDKQDEIADVFENWEYMKRYDIGLIRKIAKAYYDVDKIRNMEEYADHWNSEYLYTLIEYEGEDILLHVGTGEFTPEMFTRRDIPEFIWLSHSPLKLFVTSSWARKQDMESEPTEFLDHHAIIYSPKWGQVKIRDIHAHKPINYGESMGIVKYQDALLALQNAQMHKSFPQDAFRKFCDKMEKLKKCAYEDVKKQSNTKEGFHYLKEEEKEFNEKFFACLLHLGNGNSKNMYKLIQWFDVSQQVFTKSSHKKIRN